MKKNKFNINTILLVVALIALVVSAAKLTPGIFRSDPILIGRNGACVSVLHGLGAVPDFTDVRLFPIRSGNGERTTSTEVYRLYTNAGEINVTSLTATEIQVCNSTTELIMVQIVAVYFK